MGYDDMETLEEINLRLKRIENTMEEILSKLESIERSPSTSENRDTIKTHGDISLNDAKNTLTVNQCCSMLHCTRQAFINVLYMGKIKFTRENTYYNAPYKIDAADFNRFLSEYESTGGSIKTLLKEDN